MMQPHIFWVGNLETALQEAAATKRFVLADFMKPDCAGCEALEQITFTDSAVQSFLKEQLVPVRINLKDRSATKYFQEYKVIWTPTLVFIDRRGSGHYQSPGYLPPPEFLALLQIGVARCRLAWAGYEEAGKLLETVTVGRTALIPEALYWLGIAYYLRTRRRRDLMRAWGQLQREFPDSIWSRRIAPGQGEEEVEKILNPFEQGVV